MSDDSPTLSEYSFDGDAEPSIFGNKAFPEQTAAASSTPSLAEEAEVSDQGDKTFPFMSLPTELRIKIYEHALTGDGEIAIKEGHASSKYEELDQIVLVASIGYFDYQKVKPVHENVSTKITTAMLRLHPHLMQEAREVLLRRNKFVFQGFHVTACFLQRMKASRRFLRHVEIHDDGAYDLRGSMVQLAMGLLGEAACNLEHLHFGVDLAAKFWAPVKAVSHQDAALFRQSKDKRFDQMALYLLPCLSRIFRLRHTDKQETAEAFLANVLSVHPTSFDPCGHLPLRPFLMWDEARHFDVWEPCMCFHDFQIEAADFRARLLSLLKTEGTIKIRKHEDWVIKSRTA